MDTLNNILMKLSLKNPKIPLVQLINKWSNIEVDYITGTSFYDTESLWLIEGQHEYAQYILGKHSQIL